MDFPPFPQTHGPWNGSSFSKNPTIPTPRSTYLSRRIPSNSSIRHLLDSLLCSRMFLPTHPSLRTDHISSSCSCLRILPHPWCHPSLCHRAVGFASNQLLVSRQWRTLKECLQGCFHSSGSRYTHRTSRLGTDFYSVRGKPKRSWVGSWFPHSQVGSLARLKFGDCEPYSAGEWEEDLALLAQGSFSACDAFHFWELSLECSPNSEQLKAVSRKITCLNTACKSMERSE